MSEHPGFPPDYWDTLAKAAQEMDKAEACDACMASWRSHGPGHYRAFRNIGRCAECAIRAALPVERAVLDWQYEHDPLRKLVGKLVEQYRSAEEGMLSPGRLVGPGFWATMEELDSAVRSERKEEGA